MPDTPPTSAAIRLPEYLCDDCSEGDHEACRREGGWMHQDTNERCSCHRTGHALDHPHTMADDRPSPTNTAHALGLLWTRDSSSILAWDDVLDAAVEAYWLRRPGKQAA